MRYLTKSRKRYLKTREVIELVGMSRSTIWRLEQAGEFPSRRQLSPGRVGWLEEEIEDWMESRTPVGRDAESTDASPIPSGTRES